MKTPIYHIFTYVLNQETSYYELNPFFVIYPKITKELKLEPTHQKHKIKSDYIIRGRIKNGEYLYFTGIIRTNNDNWFFGDYYEYTLKGKVNSYNLFRFSNDRFDLYFFPSFKLYPKKRGEFNKEFIKKIEAQKKGGEYPTSLGSSNHLGND